jgi:hypothetical protein
MFVMQELTLEWSKGNVLHLGKLLAFPTNIALGWKGLPGTNTLGYFTHP